MKKLVIVCIFMLCITGCTTPIGTVKNSKENVYKDAFEDTAYGIVKSGELYYSKKIINGDNLETKVFNFPDGESVRELNIKGKIPKTGHMTIYSDGYVELVISDDKYCARKTKDSEKITIDKDLKTCY